MPHRSLALALLIAIHCARTSVPPGNSGEQVCEGHGYDSATCAGLGCCSFADGECWSGVGSNVCTGSSSSGSSGSSGGGCGSIDTSCQGVMTTCCPYAQCSTTYSYSSMCDELPASCQSSEAQACTTYIQQGCCAAFISPPPPSLPPVPMPPPTPPATPGAAYVASVSYSKSYVYEPLLIETSDGQQVHAMSIEDIQRYAPGGLANFTRNLEATELRDFPNATACAVSVSAGSVVVNYKLVFDDVQLANAAADALAARLNPIHATVLSRELVPAPSPPPPPPPPFTYERCDNTCKAYGSWLSTYDGQCQDGLGIAECPFGSDCADCGPRVVCDPADDAEVCSLDCQQRAWRDGTAGGAFCASVMIGNGHCDAACNNWECGHDFGDCDEWEHVVPKCTVEQEALGNALTRRPGRFSSLTNQTLAGHNASELVAMQLRVQRFPAFSLDRNTEGVWIIKLTGLELGLQWRDSRLLTAPCTRVLHQMYTIARSGDRDTVQGRAEVQSHKRLLWFPHLEMFELDLTDLTVDTRTNTKKIASSSFLLTPGAAPWQSAARPADGSGACVDCAALNLTTAELSFVPQLNLFTYYPFDTHDFTFRFTFVGFVRVFSCDIADFLPSGTDPNLLLPVSGEWTATGGVEVRPTTDGDGEVFGCEVVVPAQRNFWMFLVKQVAMSIAIVYAGLASLYMHIADHTGDRAALIGVSLLIVIFNFQNELVIGAMPYLVWWDIFNLFAFAVLCISLAISLVEHKQMIGGNEEAALTLNLVSRQSLLFCVYPSILVYLFVAGLNADYGHPAAVAVLVLGVVLPTLLAVLVYRRRMRKGHRDRQQVVARLRATPVTSHEFHRVLEDAFHLFDVDSSGFLDICEARDLFHILFYDDLGAERFAQAMVDVRVFLDHKGELNLDAVVDALVFVTSKYGLGVPESKVPKQLETAASFDSDAKARPYVGISRRRVSPGPQQGGSA